MNPQNQNDNPSPEQPNTPYERAAAPQSQQSAFSPAPAPKRRSRKVLLVFVIIVLVLGALVAAVLMSPKDKKDTNNQSAQNSSQSKNEVPDDWEAIDTGLGFSMKAPEGWEASPPTETTLDNLKTNSVVISAPDVVDTLVYVVASIQSLTDKPGQAAFEASLTEIDPATEAQLQELGLSKEDVTISSDHVTIGGKEWLRVITEAPDPTTSSTFYTSSFFLWQGDHAITLTIIQPSKEKLASTTDSYIKPMAASVVVTN